MTDIRVGMHQRLHVWRLAELQNSAAGSEWIELLSSAPPRKVVPD
jgi:hypothetical protein